MSRKIKVCLYLEFYHFWGGIFFKKIGTGLLYSYKNQKKILNELNIQFSEKWDNSCDILQINTPWLNSIRLIKKARRKNKKVIIWAHVTVEDTQQVFRFAPYVSGLVKKYLTYAYGMADIVVCPSEYTKSLLKAYGLPEEKLVVQSNGVDLKKFQKDAKKREIARRKRKLEGIVVGSVGLVIPRKGVDDFIFLARKFSKNYFVWYGKIYSSLLVKPLPKELPSNVAFTGYVEDSDMTGSFNALDIFIFPSFEENQGMVLLEAAAVGLPLLIRDIPVYRGWLEHNENCLKAKNLEDFKKYLDRLIHDEGLRKRLGENALQMAQEHNLERIKEEALNVYISLMK